MAALDGFEYPFCNITIAEATGENRGHVTPDGCTVYYNPSQGGVLRLEELLRELLAVRRRNIVIDPERYGYPRD